AFDMAGRRQQNLAGMDAADHLAADGDVLGPDLAMDFRLLADHQARAAHIAFDDAVDLDVARGVEGARDRKVGADDGGHRTSAARTLGLAHGLTIFRRHESAFLAFAREHDDPPL